MKFVPFVFFCFSCLFAYAGDFSLRDLGNGNAEISRYEGNSASVSVPSTVDGKRITRIGEQAFFGNETLRSVSFSEPLTEIAPFAFAHCSNLERVNFPSSLKKIGSRAFFACEKISTLELPASLESLGDGAFALCSSLKTLFAPTFIAKLGDHALPLNAKALFSDSKFPELAIDSSVDLLDPSGDDAIDAEESCTLRVSVKNSGEADAYGCRLKIALETPNPALKFPSEIGIAKLAAGKTVTAEIPIYASRGLANGKAGFVFAVKEPKGIDSAECSLAVDTRAFAAPLVKIVDFAVSGQGNSVLKKNSQFDLQVFLQNVEKGRAEEVVVELELPERIILSEGEQKQEFKILRGGESKPLEYSLFVPRRYRGNEIPVRVKISEKYGQYAESWETSLRLDSAIATTKTEIVSRPSDTPGEIRIASFGSEVDKNIPVNEANDSRNIFVAIIANENYDSGTPAVDYALNDGKQFREYCRLTLGVPESQIKFFENASGGKMDDALTWLAECGKYVSDAELFFYYAGHGFPEDETASAYLLPTDVSPSNLHRAHRLSDVYRRLSESGAKFSAVFLDACFSGMTRSDDAIDRKRAVRRKVSVDRIPPNVLVFAAASGNQTAGFFKNQSHGIFTYELLKKLKMTEGKVSFRELKDYLDKKIPESSQKNNGKAQVPSISAHEAFPYWDQKLYLPEK